MAILFQLMPHTHLSPTCVPSLPWADYQVLIFLFLGFCTSIKFSDFDPILCLCLCCHFFDSSFRTNFHVSTTSLCRRLWSTPPLPCSSSNNKAMIFPKHFRYGKHCEFHSKSTIWSTITIQVDYINFDLEIGKSLSLKKKSVSTWPEVRWLWSWWLVTGLLTAKLLC